MKKKLLFVSISVGLSILFGFAGFIYALNNSEINPGERQRTINVSAEWATEPTSINDLIDNSDLVVIGSAKIKKDKEGNKTIKPYKDDGTIIYTEYDFKIKHTLKGDKKDKRIDMINYGGIDDRGNNIVWENIEKINEDDLYLLFLEKIPNSTGVKNDPRAGKYRPISGPSGIYKITSNKGEVMQKLNTVEEISIEALLNHDLDIKVETPVLNIQEEVMESGLKEVIEKAEKVEYK